MVTPATPGLEARKKGERKQVWVWAPRVSSGINLGQKSGEWEAGSGSRAGESAVPALRGECRREEPGQQGPAKENGSAVGVPGQCSAAEAGEARGKTQQRVESKVRGKDGGRRGGVAATGRRGRTLSRNGGNGSGSEHGEIF